MSPAFVVQIADHFAWAFPEAYVADIAEGEFGPCVWDIQFLPILVLLFVKQMHANGNQTCQKRDEQEEGNPHVLKAKNKSCHGASRVSRNSPKYLLQRCDSVEELKDTGTEVGTVTGGDLQGVDSAGEGDTRRTGEPRSQNWKDRCLWDAANGYVCLKIVPDLKRAN